MESNLTKKTINDVLKRFDLAFVDDNTYNKLLNMGFQYEYVDIDLLKQAIETELIIMLYND